MMLTLALGLLLAAEAPFNVAATDFTTIGDLKPETVSFLNEHFAQRLAEHTKGSVTTMKNMAALIGLDRQRQLLGCDGDSSSCLAELAGALGAKAIIVGECARLETTYQLNLRIVDGATGRAVFTRAVRSPTVDALVDQLSVVAGDAGSELDARYGPRIAVRDWAPWVLVAAGAATAGGGAALFFVSSGTRARIGTPMIGLGPDAADAIAGDASLQATLALSLAVGGGVLILSGLLWRLFDSGAP
ncbi:MAG: hypothetical protein JNK82_13850 [Myxococcaceae bacterium]|nr:hypothetical protein [Myxococcaceae bacterium]